MGDASRKGTVRRSLKAPSSLEGVQRRIHCIDLLGDGFLLRLQSFDVGQLFIDFMLTLRQLLERSLQMFFDVDLRCDEWRGR